MNILKKLTSCILSAALTVSAAVPFISSSVEAPGSYENGRYTLPPEYIKSALTNWNFSGNKNKPDRFYDYLPLSDKTQELMLELPKFGSVKPDNFYYSSYEGNVYEQYFRTNTRNTGVCVAPAENFTVDDISSFLKENGFASYGCNIRSDDLGTYWIDNSRVRESVDALKAAGLISSCYAGSTEICMNEVTYFPTLTWALDPTKYDMRTVNTLTELVSDGTIDRELVIKRINKKYLYYLDYLDELPDMLLTTGERDIIAEEEIIDRITADDPLDVDMSDYYYNFTQYQIGVDENGDKIEGEVCADVNEYDGYILCVEGIEDLDFDERMYQYLDLRKALYEATGRILMNIGYVDTDIGDPIMGVLPDYECFDAIDGDANNDGELGIADATCILQSIGNPDKYALSVQGEYNADIDGNYGISANDALCVEQIIFANK